MIFEILADVLRNSILITGLVLIMMLMIEYFNIQSKGRWFAKLQGRGIKQIILGSALGLIPGCIGGFAAVSLFTHRFISFGALIAMMISSSGDEAFVILALIPWQGMLLFAILFAIAIISGIIVDKFIVKSPKTKFCPAHYEIHHGHDSSIPSIFKASSYSVMKRPSKKRLAILAGIAIFIAAVIGGLLEHDHAHVSPHGEVIHEHAEAVAHGHHNMQFNILDERWINIVFAVLSIVTLLFTATAKEHFIEEHIWGHVIKKHLLSIFLWTYGALLVCQIGIQYLDIEHWISNNMLVVMLLAVGIGIIPESGPHLVFVTLFAQGIIPFYILLVNSIVQDGHTTIPLLAESKNSFFKAKFINLMIGLLVGLLCWSITG